MNINSSSQTHYSSHHHTTLPESHNYQKTSNPETPIGSCSSLEEYNHPQNISYMKDLQDWVDSNDGSSKESKLEAKEIIQSTMRSQSSELILSNLSLATMPPLHALKHLQHVNFNFNYLHTIEPYIFSGLNLTQISLAYNDIHAIHLNAFSGLPTLDVMDLSYNSIQSIHPSVFLELSHPLRFLNLSGNKLTGFEWSNDHVLCTEVNLMHNRLNEETRDALRSHLSRTTYVV